jgi:hypothetical protein
MVRNALYCENSLNVEVNQRRSQKIYKDLMKPQVYFRDQVPRLVVCVREVSRGGVGCFLCAEDHVCTIVVALEYGGTRLPCVAPLLVEAHT